MAKCIQLAHAPALYEEQRARKAFTLGYMYVCNNSFMKDLRLRHQRRIVGLVATVPTMLLSAIASGSYFMTLEIDPSQTLGGVRRSQRA